MSVLLGYRRTRTTEPGSTFVVFRWGFLLALLVAELLVLMVRFDTGILVRNSQWWAWLLGQSSQSLKLAMAAAMAVLLVRGAELGPDLARLLARSGNHALWGVYFLGHIAAYLGFAALTSMLLGSDTRALAGGAGWFAAWLLVGFTSITLWSASLVPPRLWAGLVRGGARYLATGLLVGVLAWAAGTSLRSLWRPLSQGTFATVSGLLKLVCSDVVSQPAEFLIGTERFKVEIAPECSGYEGIGLIWVFLAAYLWLFRRTLQFPRALLLLPVGTVVIWLLNALRITALVLIGTYGYEAVALGGSHSQAGWLAFNAVGLGLVTPSRHWRILGAAPPCEDEAAESEPNAAAAYLMPLAALIGVMMMTTAVSAGRGFDRLYGLRVLAAAVVLWHYRGQYGDLRVGDSGRWSDRWLAAIIGAAVFALWFALEPTHTSADSAATAAELRELGPAGAVAWLAFRVIGSVVVVPLAEELAFRGFLMRRLIASDFASVPMGKFTWLSFLISSVLFGALHGRWLAGVLAGMVFAGALYRRRALADAVIAHATANALITGYVLATGAWSFWS